MVRDIKTTMSNLQSRKNQRLIIINVQNIIIIIITRIHYYVTRDTCVYLFYLSYKQIHAESKSFIEYKTCNVKKYTYLRANFCRCKMGLMHL